MGETPSDGGKEDASELNLYNDTNGGKMNGTTKSTNTRNEGRTQSRRRPFASAFGKRMRLFFSPWKWRRKTKRAKSLDKSIGPVRTQSGAF